MVFHDVQLELVRPGPAHNQPLSELTQYLALCGESSPVTFTVDFEHQELLSRLGQLRYVAATTDGQLVGIAPEARQAELLKLGREMGELLGKMRSLSTELSSVRPEVWRTGSATNRSELVHLRLILSGSELAILPFELAMAPDATPGEGSELFLQGRLQIVPTRETRRSRPLATRLSDFDHPKVLFAYAAPGSNVPATGHLRAIRDALDPWLGRTIGEVRTTGEAAEQDRAERRRHLKEWIRVLPNASLGAIARLCAEERFSHVHILAHGDRLEEAGQSRFGIALCDEDDPSIPHVVSGKQLALALSVESTDGNSRSGPFWVTLASCDSAAAGSIFIPGGSLAHELHVSGVPWVAASQLPLTKSGSVEMARHLYKRLFTGDDPRQALYETRRHLYITAREDHDWASLVTYASVPDDFDDDVARFFERATETAIERVMDSIDKLLEPLTGEIDPALADDIADEFATVDKLLDRWKGRVPEGDGAAARHARTIYQGIVGSARKRMAIHEARLAGTDDEAKRLARRKLIESQEAYREAAGAWWFDENLFGWVAVQALSTSAALDQDLDDEMLAILRASTAKSKKSSTIEQMAWAHSTDAELELLQLYQLSRERPEPSDLAARLDEGGRRIRAALAEVSGAMGSGSFHVASTRRQFLRWADDFGGLATLHPELRRVAEEVVEEFGAD